MNNPVHSPPSDPDSDTDYHSMPALISDSESDDEDTLGPQTHGHHGEPGSPPYSCAPSPEPYTDFDTEPDDDSMPSLTSNSDTDTDDDTNGTPTHRLPCTFKGGTTYLIATHRHMPSHPRGWPVLPPDPS